MDESMPSFIFRVVRESSSKASPARAFPCFVIMSFAADGPDELGLRASNPRVSKRYRSAVTTLF